MPPIPSQLSPERLWDYIRSLQPGKYSLEIVKFPDVFPVAEGMTYFAIGEKTVTVLRDK